MTSTRKRKTPATPVESDTPAPANSRPAHAHIDPFAHAGKTGWGVGGRYIVANGRRIRNHTQEN